MKFRSAEPDFNNRKSKGPGEAAPTLGIHMDAIASAPANLVLAMTSGGAAWRIAIGKDFNSTSERKSQ